MNLQPLLIPNATIHKYKRYLPTAFDESLSLLEKVNKIIEFLNTVINVTNDSTLKFDELERETNEKVQNLVNQFTDLRDWLEGEGLEENTSNVLNEWFINGKLETIINENVFNMKADKSEVDAISSQLAQSEQQINELFKNKVNWINALENGVVGDGLTDDTPAINAIIEGMQAGDILYFPRPSNAYLLNGTVTINKNINIVGDGKNTTMFQYTGTGIALDIRGAWNNIVKITINDIGLLGTNRTGKGINIYYGNGSTLNEIRINNFEYGVYFERTWSIGINRCEVKENKYGAYCNASDVVNNITFRDSNFSANQTINIRLTGQAHTIDSCDFSNYAEYVTDSEPIGVYAFHSKAVSIINCYYESGLDNATAVNTLEAHGLMVTNLVVSNLKNNCKVVRLQTTRNVTIDNLNVVDWEGLAVRTESYGVYLNSNSSAIIRNSIFAKLQYGIMNYFKSNMVVENPTFIECTVNIQIRDENSFCKLLIKKDDLSNMLFHAFNQYFISIELLDERKSASTASRPTGSYLGQQYFNTSTNSWDTWNGTKWVKFDGTDA